MQKIYIFFYNTKFNVSAVPFPLTKPLTPWEVTTPFAVVSLYHIYSLALSPLLSSPLLSLLSVLSAVVLAIKRVHTLLRHNKGTPQKLCSCQTPTEFCFLPSLCCPPPTHPLTHKKALICLHTLFLFLPTTTPIDERSKRFPPYTLPHARPPSSPLFLLLSPPPPTVLTVPCRRRATSRPISPPPLLFSTVAMSTFSLPSYMNEPHFSVHPERNHSTHPTHPHTLIS